ncbi:uncharacterized protein [Littorina saxatilis]|uniref:Uncharacterized protein n=1 Tax=Littorina saxatilis TaxID=31220 RepID=A0AAN9GCG3_9CAEN
MAMGTKKETCLSLAALLLALTSCLAKRPDVITVVGGGSNERFNLMPGSDVVTYRVIMPDREACPTPSLNTTAFDWKVQFTVNSSKPDAKICVDFGRLKLTGNSTKFTVNSGRWSDYMLTPSRYPLNRKSMSTVKCSKDEDEVTLMFHSDCDGNLKDYFSSWIYVYYQTSSHPVYHLDGNCRHKYRMGTFAQQMTVRSYIWNDVSNETLPQDCTLELSESYSSYVYSHNDAKLCTKWTFQQTACQLSARQKQGYSLIDTDVSDLYGATIADCQTGFNAGRLATCQRYSLLRELIIGARREQDGKIPQTEEKEDGALFFEMEVTMVVEEKKQETYEPGDFAPPDVFDDTETESEAFDFNGNLFFKTLAPVALLIGVCSCLCGIYRKKAKNQQAQFPVAPYAASVLRTPEHMPGSSAPGPQSIAMQPLMGPGNNAQSYTSYPIWVPNGNATEAGRLESDRIAAAAPPPSYTDVTSGGSQPHASPRPPYAASTELPPPPFSPSPSVPPAAPPAYNDLYPSNN